MADEADIADRAQEILLKYDIERTRARVSIKAAPHPDGLCCNDCGDDAQKLPIMVAKADLQPDPAALSPGAQIRTIAGVPTVFVQEGVEITRFCSKECAQDFEMRNKQNALA